MMHEHDFDLIATIAEGAMSLDEQTAAEASFAPCEECRTELQLQREALQAMRASSAASMTDLERAALRRNVAAALTPVATRSDSTPTIPWFQRLMPAMAAAAALLVVVGVGSVLVNGAGDADTAADIAAETTTTAATTEESLRAGTDEESDGDLGGAAFDDVAETTTTPMAAAAPQESNVREFGSITGAELANVVGDLKALEETEGANLDSMTQLQSFATSTLVCAEIALDEGPIATIGRATVDGDDVEIYRINDLVNVYLAIDCSLTASFE